MQKLVHIVVKTALNKLKVILQIFLLAFDYLILPILLDICKVLRYRNVPPRTIVFIVFLNVLAIIIMVSI